MLVRQLHAPPGWRETRRRFGLRYPARAAWAPSREEQSCAHVKRAATSSGTVEHNARVNIDAMIALAMAVERAEQKPEPVELLGSL
jgi:hypothetical protein